MNGSRTINWSQLHVEIRRRWVLIVLVGVYLVIGGLFAILIYSFGWDQSATRWAAQIYPLPAARVNGDTIWLSKYYRRLRVYEHYDARVVLEQPDLLPEDPYERKTKVLDELVQIMLLTQEAKKAGITVTTDEITAQFDRLMEANGGREKFALTLADFYGLTPEDFSQEFVLEQIYREKIQEQLFTQVHVRHIVLKDEGAATDILNQVKAGEDFGELAKNFSQDLTTRESGGDLGWVRRGQLVKPFEDAAFALAAGAVAEGLVQTEFGYHIVKVDERKDAPIADQSFTDWFAALVVNAHVKKFVPKAPAPEPSPAPETAVPSESVPAETPAPAAS